jgi:hypothetical protein
VLIYAAAGDGDDSAFEQSREDAAQTPPRRLAEDIPQQATATPAPSPTPTPPPVPPPTSVLSSNRIISFYGHPFTPIMGVLGSGTIDQVAAQLRRQAAAYDALDPARPAKPALHLIYAVAQASAGRDGSYLYHTDDAIVREYIDFTREQDMLLFIDLQNGRNDPRQEVRNVLPYLAEPHVHLALDPEFTMTGSEVPGEDIGNLTGPQINAVQKMLQALVLEHRLPNKMLVVHQFQDDMVVNKEAVTNFDRVDLVFDMDGFGGADTKVEKYYRFSMPPLSDYAAIKLFYVWDVGLLSPESLLTLDPPPALVIYQ